MTATTHTGRVTCALTGTVYHQGMGYNPGREGVVGGKPEDSRRDEAVVLIHGLWMTGTEMRVLGGRLEESGFRVRYFRYRSWRGGLAQAAGALREFVEATDGERVHLVGHSLGGVVISKMLEGGAPFAAGSRGDAGVSDGRERGGEDRVPAPGRAMARGRRDPGGDRRAGAEVAGRTGTSRRRRGHPVRVGASSRSPQAPRRRDPCRGNAGRRGAGRHRSGVPRRSPPVPESGRAPFRPFPLRVILHTRGAPRSSGDSRGPWGNRGFNLLD